MLRRREEDGDAALGDGRVNLQTLGTISLGHWPARSSQAPRDSRASHQPVGEGWGSQGGACRVHGFLGGHLDARLNLPVAAVPKSHVGNLAHGQGNSSDRPGGASGTRPAASGGTLEPSSPASLLHFFFLRFRALTELWSKRS